MKLRILFILGIYISLIQCSAKRIGIVGAGIGGTASAYFLHQLLGDECEIDVFEPRRVGGRLQVISVGGREYEAGGAIIHSRNLHMQRFVMDLGLNHRGGSQIGKMGLFDGNEFVFKEGGSDFVTTMKMIWHYGFSLFSLNKLTTKRLDMFDNIYKYQDQGVCFKTAKQLLNAMSADFPTSTQTAAKQGLLDAGLGERLVEELIGATMRVNYGQSMERAHEFVAFVSVAGAANGNLWAVEDGNYQVPKHLLTASQANLVPHAVQKIAALDSGEFELFWRDDENLVRNSTYDAVIVATPITDELYYKIEMPDLMNRIPTRHMHRLVVTFVRGAVNFTTFGGETDISDIICTQHKPWFNSLSRVYPVDGSVPDASERPVYKVFSSAPLTAGQLDLLFTERLETLPLQIHAYPQYSFKDAFEGNFELRPGLFYLNAIEWAASAMEMSSVSANNVALLVRNHLHPELEVPFSSVSSGATRNEL